MNFPFREVTWEDGTTTTVPRINQSGNGWFYKPIQAKPKRKNETFGRSSDGEKAAMRWLVSWMREQWERHGNPVSTEPVPKHWEVSYRSAIAGHMWRTPLGDVWVTLQRGTTAHIAVTAPTLFSRGLFDRATSVPRAITTGHMSIGTSLDAQAKDIIAEFVKDPWGLVPDAAVILDGGTIDYRTLLPGDVSLVPSYNKLGNVDETGTTAVVSDYAVYLPDMREHVIELAKIDLQTAFDTLAHLIPEVSAETSYTWRGREMLRYVGIAVDLDEHSHIIHLYPNTGKVEVECSVADQQRERLERQADEVKRLLGELDTELDETDDGGTQADEGTDRTPFLAGPGQTFRTVSTEVKTIPLGGNDHKEN